MATNATREPVPDQSQSERAYLEIRRRIVDGRYRPGMHLSETMLARIHRSSRTPIREALSRLLQEGYVQLTPKRGYAVAQVTLALANNIYKVRRLLECDAAAVAASKATPREIERLWQLAPGVYVESQQETYHPAMENNLDFHLTVAETTGNTLLVELVRQCLTQMERVLALGIDYGPFGKASKVEHERIVQAIANHSVKDAKRAMDRHLAHSHELLINALIRGTVRNVNL